MTVQQLIDTLILVEDKNIPVRISLYNDSDNRCSHDLDVVDTTEDGYEFVLYNY